MIKERNFNYKLLLIIGIFLIIIYLAKIELSPLKKDLPLITGNAYFIVNPNDEVTSNVQIINPNSAKGEDFILDYFLVTPDKSITYSSNEEVIYIPPSGSINKEIKVTAPSLPGTYELWVIITWSEGVLHNYDTIQVTSDGQEPVNVNSEQNIVDQRNSDLYNKEKYNVTAIFIAFLLLFGVVIIIYLIMVIKVMGKER